MTKLTNIKKSLVGSNFYLILFGIVFLSFCFVAFTRIIGIIFFSAETAYRFGAFAPIADFLLDLIPIFVIPASFMYIIFFILPGFLIANLLIARNILDKKYMLLLSIVFSSVIAYVVFWVYFLLPLLGQLASILVVFSSIALLIIYFKKIKPYILDVDFIRPLTLLFLVGCLFLSILFLYFPGYDYINTANVRYGRYLPGDNLLMYSFVNTFFHGFPISEYDGEWLVSDRPPLFGTIILFLQRFSVFGDNKLFYQFVGTFVQCFWVPGLYALCKFFSFDNKVSNFIIGTCVFSGIFLINSTYLWSKFSTLIYFSALLLLIFELSDRSKITKNSIYLSILVGICAALALLTHGGVAFSLIALGLAFLITEKRLNLLKHAAGTFISFFIVYLPWILFQRLVDPPGNRLMKWYFAGMQEVNDYSFLEAMYIAYVDRPIGEIIHKTIDNIFFLFPDTFKMSLQAIRDEIFSRVFGAPMFLNIFIIILGLYFVKKYCFDKEPMSYRSKVLFYFTIFSFTIWPLLIYNFSYTLTFLGSYVNILLLYILVAFGAKHTNNELRNVLYIANIIFFVALWVLHPDVSIFALPSVICFRSFVTMIISAVLFFIYLHKKDDDEKAENI